MGKYNIGDSFKVEVKSVREACGGTIYEVTGKTLLYEDVLDGFEKTRENLIEIEKNVAYKQGLLDAWDTVKKLIYPEDEDGIGADARYELFGNTSILRVVYKFSFGEIKEIIDKYEERKIIKEGDIVEILDQKAVVLAIDKEIANVYVVDNDDGKVQEVALHRLKRVGPSIDVKETLLNECVAATCRHAKDVRDNV